MRSTDTDVTRYRALAALIVGCLIGVPCVAAQDEPAGARTGFEGADAPEAPSQTAGEGKDTSSVAEESRTLELGFLSDPAAHPQGVFDALFGGKIHLDNRLRIEHADTTGRDSSTAITNRLRLGYGTKPINGLSAFVEGEWVVTPNEDNYFVPQTGDGSSWRTPIADPEGLELNQAWGRYHSDEVGGSSLSLDMRLGRQRIQLDNQRFVGNVGWRQFEQTYDSVSARSNLGLDRLSVFYAYVWGVQRVFGPDGDNPDSDSHLVNASYKVAPQLTVTPFLYALDFEGDEPANSTNSYGVRLTGDLWRSGDEAEAMVLGYELAYARQTDAGSNPTDYAANFVAAEARLSQKGIGALTAGYQLLGSDDGNAAFRFPLGTNHAFQGFADNFLTTPAEGLQDLYAGVGAELPGGVNASVVYHHFWSDEGGSELGSEIDLVAGKSITPNWSVLMKAAFFDGEGGEPNTTRLWVQTEFKF